MAEATTLQALQKALGKSGNSRETNKRIKVPFARNAMGTPNADVYIRPENRQAEIEAAGATPFADFVQKISPSIQKAITAYGEVQEEKELNNVLSTYETMYQNGSDEDKEKWNKSTAGLNSRQARLLSAAIINKDISSITAKVNDLAIEQDVAGKALDTEDYANKMRAIGSQVTASYVQANPTLAKIPDYAVNVGNALNNYLVGQVSQYGSTFKATRAAQNEEQTQANFQAMLQNPSPDRPSLTYNSEAGIPVEVYSPSLTPEEKEAVAKNSADLKAFFSTTEGKQIYTKVINDAVDRQAKNLPTSGYNKRETRQERISTFLKKNKMSASSVFDAVEVILDNDPSKGKEIASALEGVTLGTGLLSETAPFKLGFTALLSKARRNVQSARASAAAETNAIEKQQRRNAIRIASQMYAEGRSIDDVKNVLVKNYPSYIANDVLNQVANSVFYTPSEEVTAQRFVYQLTATGGISAAQEWIKDNIRNARVANSLLTDAESFATKPPITKSITYQSFSSDIERLSGWSFGMPPNTVDKEIYDTLNRQGTEAFENLYVLRDKGRRDETISMLNAYAKNTRKITDSNYGVTYNTSPAEEVKKMRKLLYVVRDDGKTFLRDIKTLSNSEQRELGTLMSNAVHYLYKSQNDVQKVDKNNLRGNGWRAETK